LWGIFGLLLFYDPSFKKCFFVAGPLLGKGSLSKCGKIKESGNI
jgi:hypothetical protein